MELEKASDYDLIEELKKRENVVKKFVVGACIRAF